MPVVKYQRQIQQQAAPTVQRQEFRIGQVEAPAPRPTSSPEALGAGFGNTLASVGEQLYAEEQHKQDQIRLLDADKQAGQLENQLMYDPKSGALNIKGQAAFGLPDQVGKSWDDGAAKIRQGLSNDRQRMAFDEHTVSKRQVMMDRLQQHVATESYRVDGEALEGKVENETQAAIADGRPERIGQAVDSIAQAYHDYADRYGIAAEQTKSATAKAISRIHLGVIGRMLDNGNDIQAKVYYEHAEEDILPDQRGKVEASLKKETTLGDAQRVADSIKPKYSEDMSQADLEAEIPKLTNDPEVRAKAEEILGRWFAQKRSDTNFRETQASKTAKGKLDELETQLKNTMDRSAKNLSFEQVVPQSVRDQLPLAVEKSLREYHKSLTEDKKVETDPGTFYGLMREAAHDPNKFVSENLMGVLHKLDKSDWKKLVDLQSDIVKDNRKEAGKTMAGFLTHEQIINSSLRTINIDPDVKENKPLVDSLWSAVGKRVDVLEQQTGQKASNEDIQAIVDDELTPITITEKGLLYDTTTTEPKFKLQPDKIPPSKSPRPKEPTAVNPKTGERLVLRNGQWVKP